MHEFDGRRMRRMTIVQDAPLVDQVGVVGVRDLGEARDLPGVAHQTNSLMAPMTVTPAAAAL